MESYHKPTDNFENLDRATAYNYLHTVSEMASFGAMGEFLQNNSNQDGVYFPVTSGHLLLMSSRTAYFLAGLSFFTALFWLIYQMRIRKIRIRQLAAESGWLIGIISTMAAISFCVILLLMQTMKLASDSNNPVLLLCLIVIFGVGTLVIFISRMKKKTFIEALANLLPLQLLLIIVTTLFFKEISYLFTLPTFAVIGIAFFERNSIVRIIISTITGVGIMLLYVPVCWLIYVLFMLPITSLVIALSVIPISFISTFFGAK